MATPSTPVNPFKSTGKKATGIAANPFAPKAKVDNSPLANVMKFGQSVIDTVSTPLYALEGAVNQAAKETKAPTANPLASIFEAAGKNATAWTRGEQRVAPEDLLYNMGLIPSKDFGTVKIGETPVNLFGLAADIALDPLTYVPGGVIVTALKAPAIAGRAAIKAGKLASTGQIAESVARKIASTEGARQVVGKALPGEAIKFKAVPKKLTSGYTPARIEAAQATERIAAEFGQSLTKLEKKQIKAANIVAKTDPALLAYKTVSLGGTPLSTVNAAVASAIDAGMAGLRSTILTDSAKRSLRKLNRAETKLINKGVATNIPFEAAISTVRQVEDKAVKAGESALAMQDGTVQTVKPNTIFQDGDTVHIWDGKNVRTWAKGTPEQNQAAAREYLDSVVNKPAKPVVIEGRPLIDTPPVTSIVQQIKNIKAPTAEIKNINKMLGDLDKIAAGAKGVAIAGDNVAYKVSQILNSIDPRKLEFFASLRAGLKDSLMTALKGDRGNLFDFIRHYATQDDKQAKSLVGEILNIAVIDARGNKTTVREMFNNAEWATISSDTRTSIVRAVKEMVFDNADMKTAAGAKLGELDALIGPELTDKIAKTGVLLDPTKGGTALKKILEDLKAAPKASQKSYANFDEFMAGLRAEDQISTVVLEKVLNTIDPEHALIKQVDKAAAQDYNQQLRNIIDQKGIQLVTDARRRLELLDPAKTMKAKGLALSDAISSYLTLRLAGELPPAGKAVMESRQEAVDRIVALYNGPADQQKIIKRALLSLGTATDSRMEDFFEIMQAEGANIFVSSLNDAAMKSTTKAFQETTRAANYLQNNQSFQAQLAASIFGLMRSDAAAKATTAAKKMKELVPTDQIERFTTLYSLAESASLAITGARFVVSKSAASAGFDVANKHFIYSHIGDFAEIMRDTGRPDLVMKSIIPNTATKTDSFSTIGIMDSIRMIIEGRELNQMPTFDDIVKRLLSKNGQPEWSKEFMATNPKQTAEEIAKHLLNKDVIELFENVHKTRATAAVEDSLGEIITMTQDTVQALLDGYRANKLSGNLSDASRRALMREAFAKFAFAAGFMEQKTGEQAKAMMEIAANMFLKDGRLVNIKQVREFTDAKVLPEDAGQIDQIMGSIDSMYQYKNPYSVPAVGSEHLPMPKPATQAKAAETLTGKELAFDAHMRSWSEVKTAEESTKWAATYKRLSKQLDTARANAVTNHLPTRHWDGQRAELGQDPWVDSKLYNHSKAVKAAEKSATRIAVVGEKQVDRIAGMTDSKPIDMGRKMNAEQSKRIVANWNEKAAQRAAELADGASQDAAQRAIDVQKEIEKFTSDPYEIAYRMEHERIAFKYSQIEEVIDIPEGSVYRYSPTYEGYKFAKDKGVETVSKFKTFVGRFNAGTNAQAVSSLRIAETTGFNAKNKISAVTRTLGDDLTKIDMTPFAAEGEVFKDAMTQQRTLRGRAFSAAFNHALNGAPVPAQYGEQFAAVVQKMTRLISGVKDQIANLNMDPVVLDRYFKKYGVTDYEGFNKASSYKNPESLANFLNDLPFNENPYEVGSDAFKLFADRKAAFEASQTDAFIMFSNIVFSLVDAKTEQVFVHDFISQFGHRAEGLTTRQALERGYVKVAAVPGSVYDLSVHIPKKDVPLFDPTLAREFANLNREWSYMQGKAMKPILRYMMDMTGILKATQTILRPGHVMTNVVGDMTTALIGGARSPKHWYGALRMAKAFMKDRVGAEGFLYAKGDTEKQINSAISHLARLEKNPQAAIAEATKGGYTVTIKGKKETLPDDFWVTLGEDTGVATDNMVTNDIQGLFESAQARGIDPGSRGMVAKTQYAKIKEGFDKAIKPAGDVTAYYSNISRFASMLSIVDKKSWSSMDELKRAVTDHVALYHPTITSLAATERRYPRAIFTYYTWLRVAHNALIDMALNHTAAMTLYPKIQYSAAEQSGYEPVSLGNAWGTIAQTTPQYMNYSVYSPMGEEGPRGPVLFKPSLLPMDVLDTWNWTYDPYKSFDENIGTNMATTGRKIGSMTNVVAQPALEFLTQTDMLTGQKTQIKDAQTAMDDVISNLGYGTLLKGIGAWTPANKRPENTSNPITDRDRELYLQNWMLGLKRQDVNTVSNLKNTKTEQSARLKQFMEWYTQQQKETK